MTWFSLRIHWYQRYCVTGNLTFLFQVKLELDDLIVFCLRKKLPSYSAKKNLAIRPDLKISLFAVGLPILRRGG
jgi:hypothetical protein